MIQMHMIGAEDMAEEGYAYNMGTDSWASLWRGSQNVRKPRNNKEG